MKSIPSNSKKKKKKSSSKKGPLTPRNFNTMKRHSTSSLHSSKKGKKTRQKGKRNIITGNNEFDKYSYGECIMSIYNSIHF